ncbi:hypothetical protein GCM10023191_100100 [Actinoallomurus oryzae]|uniref:Uncharacterized protein n=1 Tax=Actinoallomurus oryzae TaxID=502180 RepID=A0ABP8R9U1_9ACTN
MPYSVSIPITRRTLIDPSLMRDRRGLARRGGIVTRFPLWGRAQEESERDAGESPGTDGVPMTLPGQGKDPAIGAGSAGGARVWVPWASGSPGTGGRGRDRRRRHVAEISISGAALRRVPAADERA